MQQAEQYSDLDIVVVGAGMVGLTAALAFVKSGFKVLVVDGRDSGFLSLPETLAGLAQQREDIASYDNRVSALTKASTRILENLNVWPKIEGLRLSPYQHMRVWDGDGSGNISFSSAELYEDNLGHIVENSVALAALLETAREQELPILSDMQVTAMSEYSANALGKDALDGGYRQLTCRSANVNESDKSSSKEQNTITLKARLIVGADGAMSKIRQLAAIPLWQWDYGHHAIVATVATDEPNQATAWQRFTNDGPLAFLPLSNPHFSSIVWSTSPAHAKDLMAMDDEQFCQALAKEFEHTLGKVSAVSNRAVFPLRQRHAKHYVQEGLALIGDAIHTIHPLAGQGVNLGLLDVAALAQVLASAKDRRQNVGDEQILKQFQRMRHTENLAMSAAMQTFKWLFDPQPAAITIARNMGMNLLNKAAPVKQHIIKQAMGLSSDLPDLAKPAL